MLSSANQFSIMDRFIQVTCLLVILFSAAESDITDECMKCICKAKGCEIYIGHCRMDDETLSCGPYQIKYPYWLDCGKPGGDWKNCTMEMECSEKCVRAYTKRYGTYCTGGHEPTCEDYSKIHNDGPLGCQTANDYFWDDVKRCLG